MNLIGRCGFSALVCGVLAGPVLGMQDAASPPEPAATQQLEEVEVIGRKLSRMRQEIVEAEERFYALYNKLNTRNDFDIECRIEAPLGTKLKRRICQPLYVLEAQSVYARDFLDGRRWVTPDSVAQVRSDEFRKSMLAVINKNPQLLRLVREREEREAAYIKARKERLKGRLFLFE